MIGNVNVANANSNMQQATSVAAVPPPPPAESDFTPQPPVSSPPAALLQQVQQKSEGFVPFLNFFETYTQHTHIFRCSVNTHISVTV